MRFREFEDLLNKSKSTYYEINRYFIDRHKNILTYDLLNSSYLKLTDKLNRTYQHCNQSLKTPHEKRFYKMVTTNSTLDIHRSIWISNHCVDLFVPRLKLIVEVDGGIHQDNEFKIRKDNLKDDFLTRLGLTVHHVDNENIGRCSSELQALLNSKPDLKNTRTLWKTIFMETLSAHCEPQELMGLVIKAIALRIKSEKQLVAGEGNE